MGLKSSQPSSGVVPVLFSQVVELHVVMTKNNV